MRRADGLRFALLVCVCLIAARAQAHEGHDHPDDADHADYAVATDAPRLVHVSPRLEAVAVIDGQGLSVWVDDFASNRPLTGLDVSVQTASGLLHATESGAGLYRLPRDLLGEGQAALSIRLHGAGFEEAFDGRLPVPAAHREPVGSQPILWVGGLLLTSLVLVAGLRVWRRRGRG